MEKNEFLALAVGLDVADCCARLEQSFEVLSNYVGWRRAQRCLNDCIEELKNNIDKSATNICSSSCTIPKNSLDK